MKYLAALSYATAAAAGSGALVDVVVIGVCVALGTLCALLAIKRMIDDALDTRLNPGD